MRATTYVRTYAFARKIRRTTRIGDGGRMVAAKEKRKKKQKTKRKEFEYLLVGQGSEHMNFIRSTGGVTKAAVANI